MSKNQPTPPTERQRLLDEAVRRTTQTPGSGIAMCHRQGKTAVYLSDDEKYIVEHPPHGPTKHTPVGGARLR